MDYNEFEKIENEMNEISFSKSNKDLSKKSLYAGIVGNFLSAIFAFVFIQKSISGLDDNIPPYILYPTYIITILLIIGFEMFKRDVFRKVIVSFLNKKPLSKSIGFTIFGAIVVSISAWLSIHGSSELANRTISVQANTEIKIKKITDSLHKRYDTLNKSDLSELTNQKKYLTTEKNKLSQIQNDLDIFYQEKKYIDPIKNNSKRETISEIEKIEKEIIKFEKRIEENNKKRDEEINLLTKSNKQKLKEQISSIESNQIKFILLSTFIELLIVFGVGFVTYYDFKTYHEKVNTKEYKDLILCKKMIDIIYFKGKLKENDKVMPLNKFYDACTINGIPNNISIAFIDLMEKLEIIKIINQQTRLININYNLANKEIEKYFNFI